MEQFFLINLPLYVLVGCLLYLIRAFKDADHLNDSVVFTLTFVAFWPFVLLFVIWGEGE